MYYEIYLLTEELYEYNYDAQYSTRNRKRRNKYAFSRLEALQAIKENPMQVQIKQFGSATAFSSKVIAGPAFNTVKVLQIQLR